VQDCPTVMFRILSLASCFLAASANSDASDQSANPVRKIVTLMQDMQKELVTEHSKEQELYDKFMCFCTTGEDDLKKTSADAAASIESLSASLEEMKAEKSGLEEDLVKHNSELGQAQSDLSKAEAVRGKESEAYEEDHANAVQATTALSKAIPALESSMAGSASASSFAQLPGGATTALKAALQKSEAVTTEEKRMVLSFMDSTQTSKTPGGQQIVGILKSINDEMLKNDASSTASETDSAKGFADLKAAKNGEIEFSKENIEKKTTRVGSLAVAIVQAADGVEDSTAEKANADKFLSTLGAQCAAKSKEWDERSKMHTDEVAAISEAVNILNADDALDVFKKTASSFIQKAALNGPHQYGFLQSGQKTGVMQLQKAERTIAAASTFYKSQKLSMILNAMRGALRSSHKVGGAVDFSAILKMVDNMIEVLGKEQADDQKHKDWCVAEHQKSDDDAATAKSTIESLDAEMANLADEISSLKDDIAALADGIKTLDKDVAQATEQRKLEHAEYLENSQLSEAGIGLLGKAKNRMQKFYNPSLYVAPEPTEAPAAFFAQISAVTHRHSTKVVQPEAPATFGKYEKNKKSGGVLQLMDNLMNELKASLAEAEHAEKSAQGEYQELMSESSETRAQDDKSLTDKSAGKAQLEGKLTSAKENKHMTLKELDNVGQYIQQLHGSCDFILDNFKLRAEARTNELEALKNAKAVLSGANYA